MTPYLPHLPHTAPRDVTTATVGTLGQQLDASLRAVLPFLANHAAGAGASASTIITTSGVHSNGGNSNGGRSGEISGMSGGSSDEQLALGLVRSLRVNNNHNPTTNHPPLANLSEDNMDIDSEPSFSPPLALALVSSRALPLPEDTRAALVLLCIVWQPIHTVTSGIHGDQGAGAAGGAGDSGDAITVPSLSLPPTVSSGPDSLFSSVRVAGRAKLARARLDTTAALDIAKGLGLGLGLAQGQGLASGPGLGGGVEEDVGGMEGGVNHLADVLMTLEVTAGLGTSNRLQTVLNGTNNNTAIDKKGGNIGGVSGGEDRLWGIGGSGGGENDDNADDILSALLRSVVLVEDEWMVLLVVKVLQQCARLQQVVILSFSPSLHISPKPPSPHLQSHSPPPFLFNPYHILFTCIPYRTIRDSLWRLR